MTMDQTTESIAHFVGLFELKTEELRLRQDYLEFRLQKAEQETTPFEPVGVQIEAPYALQPHAYPLSYPVSAPHATTTSPQPMSAEFHADEPNVLVPEAVFPDDPDDADVGRVSSVTGSHPVSPPGSLIAVTLQKITLNDDDLFVDGAGIDFVETEILLAALEALVAQAEALSGFTVPGLAFEGNWIGFAHDMLAAIDAAKTSDTLAAPIPDRGEDAHAIFVDGAAVVEMPDWTDLLPLFLQPDPSTDGDAHDDHASTGLADAIDPHDHRTDVEGHVEAPAPPQTGHQIVSGANVATNEIALYSKGLDAAVFVVQGEVARLDAISQVNALVEHDRIDGVAQSQPSAAHNIASISTISPETPEGAGSAPAAPAATFIARIEADLIQVNWVKQFTFVTDFDRAEMVFSGNSTYLGMGENQMVNSAVLNEYGYTFDLVFVEGDMVDATVISQMNVLFDTDEVTTGTASKAALAGLRESEVATASEPPHAAAELADMSGHATAPEAVASPEPESTTAGREASPAGVSTPAHVANPAKKPAFAEPEQVDHTPDVPAIPVTEPAPEPSPPLSLADNLLLNEVVIERTGTDSVTELKESFRKAAEEIKEGARTLSDDVAQDALFNGREALRVLQIEGDLARINLMEQTNIVGDADQIHLEMARLREEMKAEAELVAGSNALINRVSIFEDGIDSTIMAAQNVYSDAMIHQAGLFDADAVPNGVTLSNLTNDAVAAFIAQESVGPVDIADHIVPTGNYEAGSTADVMQTVLG